MDVRQLKTSNIISVSIGDVHPLTDRHRVAQPHPSFDRPTSCLPPSSCLSHHYIISQWQKGRIGAILADHQKGVKVKVISNMLSWRPSVDQQHHHLRWGVGIIRGGSFEGGDGPPPPKKSKQQLREKSLWNKQGYATSKWVRSEEKLHNVKWEVMTVLAESLS